MPTGIYDRSKAKPNAGLIKKGEHRSPSTEFKRGQHASSATEFKVGIGSGLSFEERHCTTEEWRKKQSEAHRGQHSSPATEIKKGLRLSPSTEFKRGHLQIYIPRGSNRPDISGENHWNWKGGVSSEIVKLRSSGPGREWRRRVFERDHFTCQKCGQLGGQLEAHHIIPVVLRLDLIFDIGNGITLCKSCHGKVVRPNAKEYESSVACENLGHKKAIYAESEASGGT